MIKIILNTEVAKELLENLVLNYDDSISVGVVAVVKTGNTEPRKLVSENIESINTDGLLDSKYERASLELGEMGIPEVVVGLKTATIMELNYKVEGVGEEDFVVKSSVYCDTIINELRERKVYIDEYRDTIRELDVDLISIVDEIEDINNLSDLSDFNILDILEECRKEAEDKCLLKLPKNTRFLEI